VPPFIARTLYPARAAHGKALPPPIPHGA